MSGAFPTELPITQGTPLVIRIAGSREKDALNRRDRVEGMEGKGQRDLRRLQGRQHDLQEADGVQVPRGCYKVFESPVHVTRKHSFADGILCLL